MIKKLLQMFINKKLTKNESVNDQHRLTDTDTFQQTLHASIQINIHTIRTILGQSSDLVTREFHIGVNQQFKLAIAYIDGLSDEKTIQDFILDPLMIGIRDSDLQNTQNNDPATFLQAVSLTIGNLQKINDYGQLIERLLTGETIILIDGTQTGLSCNTIGWDERAIEEPSTQTVIRGPKEGFTETLKTNTSLIRRRIKDPNLRIETRPIGRRTKTDIAMIYIHDIANPKIVEEVRRRLQRIDVDAILESGYIEEFIQDEVATPFPTIFNTERPDVVSAGILEGRIAILVDGTPFALLAPAIFAQFLQSAEDYYHRTDIATFIRLLRYVAFVLALLTPAIYIAVTTFHQEMIPTLLLISLVAQREAVPFPAIIEALLMEATFEILREAGIRMPRAIGPAISIVGALVLGDAAVQAGLVSPAMVIVVSLTAISSFVIPSYNLAITVRILRFLFMGVAAAFGLFGVILGVIVMILHMCSLRSFGIPYMSPFAPFARKDLKDTFMRFPLWAMSSRPQKMSSQNLIRENTPPPKPLSSHDKK